jgi:hypothetical protein
MYNILEKYMKLVMNDKFYLVGYVTRLVHFLYYPDEFVEEMRKAMTTTDGLRNFPAVFRKG